MLKSTVALVTGAAGSLGSATARKLIKDGLKVTLMDLPTSQGAELEKELGKKNAMYVPGDIMSESDVKEVLKVTQEKYGKLNVLVNCAGVSKSAAIYNFNKGTCVDLTDFGNIISTNIAGTVNVIRLAVGMMKENEMDEDGLRGVIVNTSGFQAFDGQAGQAAMSASCGAITSLTLTLCREFGNMGIRVMAIAPGVMDCNLTGFIPQNVTKILSNLTPSPKRMGVPDEYAHLVSAIIQNRFLNGETIRLDGGLRLHLY